MKVALRMVALILAVLAASSQLGGCSIAMALHGSPDPDLMSLAANGDREAVEAMLGPAVSETVGDDGVTYVTYEFTRGNEPSILRAATHAAFDVLTLGLWEIAGVLIESAVDAKDHEVRVVYAPDDTVYAMYESPPAWTEERKTIIVTGEPDAPD